MRTVRMTLAYDGSQYFGWQVQPNGITLQEVVERGLKLLTGESIKTIAAGRTDARVHALGQVISFETAIPIPCHNLGYGLQARLPADVVVRHVEDAPAGFHARFNAIQKRYRYVIHNAAVRSPFLERYAMWHRKTLDVPAMQQAVDRLLGRHDFRSFETDYPNCATSVCELRSARFSNATSWSLWTADDASSDSPGLPSKSTSGEFVCLDLVGDRFLYNMVRSIVGTLIHVGRGRWNSDNVAEILESRDRRCAGETAPPQGLYLVKVWYPDQLPGNQDQAEAVGQAGASPVLE